MSHRLTSTLAAAALILSATMPAAAQELWPVSVEATLGRGLGMTDGEYLSNETSGMTGDLLVAYRVRAAGTGGLVAAVSVGAQGTGSYETVCRLRPDGTCTPAIPSFTISSALVGWETSEAHFRALTGPGYVYPGHFGWQARIDLARPLFWRISLVIAGRAVLIPDQDGDTFQLLSAGAGLRLR